MSESIIQAIESVASRLAEQVGSIQGAKLSLSEALRVNQGDDLLLLAYAALFYPTLTISNGIPFARFATSVAEEPLDCFHVDLLHCLRPLGTSQDVYAAIGQALAQAWTYALDRQGLAGRFVYDSSTGFDVVYEP